MLKNFWDKIWRDDSGNIVLWQWPNIWLIGWAVLTFISLLFSSGMIADILTWAGEASLIIWCLLEIFKGVNYFRRGLGVIVLYYAVTTLLRTF